jgi:hypothetical protein
VAISDLMTRSNQQLSEPVGSEWPLVLMLDEVWLRVRRVTVHKLELSGFWPVADSHRLFIRHERDVGEHLKSDLLTLVLGRADYAQLNSETIFGAINQRFRARLPLVLSFGYELGSGLYGLVNGAPGRAAEIAELCAVFNLGVSIFDLVDDEYPDLFESFSQIFSEETLNRLRDDPGAYLDLERSGSSETLAVELRILLKIIAWFFSKLELFYKAGASKEARAKLSALLLQAHRAELRSTSAGADPTVDSMEISRAKSTLPFAVIHQIVHLCLGLSNQETETTLDFLVSNFATTFWLIDDLVDIVTDFQAGSLNSILVRAGAKPSRGQDPMDNYPVLASLLQGSYIEEAADEICTRVGCVVDTLQREAFSAEAAMQLRKVTLSYLRSWME